MGKNKENEYFFSFFDDDFQSAFSKDEPESKNEETREVLSNSVKPEADDVAESADTQETEMVFEEISSYSKSEGEILDIMSVGRVIEDEEEVYSSTAFMPKGKGKPKKKKRGFARWWSSLHGGYKALLITLTSILLILAILLVWLAPLFNYNYRELSTTDLGFENVIDKNIVNVALFGIDTREVDTFEGNSDSIMILSLNTVTKKVKIISLMRDTLVPIENNGKTKYKKINSAYATGGPELAVKTINQVFGLDISEYATVNFFGMVEIIDAIGGIDVELTEDEVVPRGEYRFALNGCIAEICEQKGVRTKPNYILTPGKHHLNGIQAVAYSRIRKVANIWGTNNDFGRTDRQRYVMEQLFNKAITLDKTKYVSLAKALIPCSETSLSFKEIMGLAFDILLESPKFEQSRVPFDDYLIDFPSNTSLGSVVYFDLDFATKLIHSFIYDDITPEAYIEANGVEKNDWYREKVGYYTPSTSTGPSDTTSDGDSEEPVDPDDSGDNTEPDESDPEESNPEDSSNPDDSSNPANPGDGSEPENPDDSQTPETPTEPSTPETPTEPSTPVTPPVESGGSDGGQVAPVRN